MSLYEGSVKRPIMTSLIFTAIVVMGVFSLTKLPVNLFPDIDTNTIMVMTSYSGASAEDIEQNVTRPLENTLNTVGNLKHITSRSSENVSIITLEFEYGYDIDDLTNDVRDKLDMVKRALPDGATDPIIFKFDSDMMPILLLSVQADQSVNGLYKILDENVANPLARIAGVGSVSIGGAPEREIYVYCDPVKLEAYNLTVEAISNIITQENRNIPGGSFDVGNETFPLRVEGEFNDPREMENIVVASVAGSDIYLRDVAEVVDTLQERGQMSFTNGVRGATIIVQKQSGANSVEICNKVKKMLPELERNLPSDVHIGMINDTSESIMNSIGSLEETVFFALLFVVLVVLFFLGRWRATFVIAITIPLSLIASFIYLLLSGGSLNIVSLSCLSIAIGLVVDDAIVVLENTTTHIERGADPKQAAIHATNEVAISVIASTLTMIAVFLPLTMVKGMAGMMFKQLGWMMCVILTVSTTSALSFTPMLCSQMLRLKKKRSRFMERVYGPIERFLDRFDRWYQRRLNWCVRHRGWIIGVCVVIFAASLLTVRTLGTEFFPSSDDSRLTIKVWMPIGTRTERSQQVAEELAEKWRADFGKDTRVINYTVGQASEDNTFASMQDNGTHIISYNVRLKNPSERKVTAFDVAAIIRADLGARPEIDRFTVSAGGGAGMGGQSTVAFEVYGWDFTETDNVAKMLRTELKKEPGVAEVRISRDEYQPEYHVEFDREKLARHGLNMSTAATYLRNRINGATASYYREDGEEYDIKVRFAPEFRTSIQDIENILLYGSQGNAVRVKDVGTVVESFTPPTIQRKDRQRINTVTAIVEKGFPMSTVVEAGQRIIREGDIPLGVTVGIAGDFEEQQDSFSDLLLLGLLILMLVYIVMAAQFESFSDPFIIMLSVPFGVGGVLIALWLSGTTLNLMSALGMVLLLGIVVKNGIVLIDYIRLCRERGQGVVKAVVTAGRSRLRPVLMTTLTTILGMVPMAVGRGEGSELWRPLGVSVIGGLTLSTVLTLILVPVVYCTFAGGQIKRQRRKHARQLALDAYWKENKSKHMKAAKK